MTPTTSPVSLAGELVAAMRFASTLPQGEAMRESLELGGSPADEPCVNVSRDTDYRDAMAREVRAYANQLRRMVVAQFGAMPDGLCLRVRWFPHDFGSYAEVVASFYDTDELGAEAAYSLERKPPARWDADAIAELEGSAVG